MISVEWFYWLMGLFWVGVGVLVARDRTNPKRLTSGLFWTLLGLCFPYSSFVVAKTAPAWPLGLVIVVIAALAGTGRLAKSGRATSETEAGDVEGADLDRDADRPSGSSGGGEGRAPRTSPSLPSGSARRWPRSSATSSSSRCWPSR